MKPPKGREFWDRNPHTITMLKHLLWPNRVYWCEKCKKHVPAWRTPGEVFALERAIRKLGGHISKLERKHGHVDVERVADKGDKR